MAIQPKSHFVNPEPITIMGLKTGEQIFCIYTGKGGKQLTFEPVAEKIGGCALGTIFKKSGKEWLGKVGDPAGLLRSSTLSTRSRTRKDIDYGTIHEKLAYDLYREFGRGLFLVPKTRLSEQKVIDRFTTTHFLAVQWASLGIQDTLRIMCRFMDGYQDFSKAQTIDRGEIISFIDYIKKHHRPPETLLIPEGQSVPLKGLMSLLATSRCLADTDVLGGRADNAGFIWIKDKDTAKIQAAQAVKIDPGESFKFIRDPAESFSMNWVINSTERLGHPQYHLSDLRDLQTANNYRETLIQWQTLTPSQQEEFLMTLFNSSRYLDSKGVLHFLFYREGKFNRREVEFLPENMAHSLETKMALWMKQQIKIYADDLKNFKLSRPELLIRVHYIDKWGELPLPMAEETFPIRELFINLRMVSEEEDLEIPPNKHVKDIETKITDPLMVPPKGRLIKLEELFNPIRGKNPQKLLLVGSSGIGKTTFCQKIAHDWASGRLWNDQFMIFWFPLKELNPRNFL